jgi:hypothetical protein
LDLFSKAWTGSSDLLGKRQTVPNGNLGCWVGAGFGAGGEKDISEGSGCSVPMSRPVGGGEIGLAVIERLFLPPNRPTCRYL